MINKDEILNELTEFSPQLAKHQAYPPYQVPENYFEIFPDTVLDLLNRTQNNMEVPAGYFETFADKMLVQVKQMDTTDELQSIAPLLSTVSKEMPFYIPEAYFENLQYPRNTALEQSKPQAVKVVPMFSKKLKEWAVAAAVVVTIGLGWAILSNENKKLTNPTASVGQVETLLSSVDASSMEGYLEDETELWEFADLLITANENIESGLKTLTTDELKTYLDKFPELPPGT